MTELFITMELIDGLVKLHHRLLTAVRSMTVVNDLVIYLMSIEKKSFTLVTDHLSNPLVK